MCIIHGANQNEYDISFALVLILLLFTATKLRIYSYGKGPGFDSQNIHPFCPFSAGRAFLEHKACSTFLVVYELEILGLAEVCLFKFSWTFYVTNQTSARVGLVQRKHHTV